MILHKASWNFPIRSTNATSTSLSHPKFRIDLFLILGNRDLFYKTEEKINIFCIVSKRILNNYPREMRSCSKRIRKPDTRTKKFTAIAVALAFPRKSAKAYEINTSTGNAPQTMCTRSPRNIIDRMSAENNVVKYKMMAFFRILLWSVKMPKALACQFNGNIEFFFCLNFQWFWYKFKNIPLYQNYQMLWKFQWIGCDSTGPKKSKLQQLCSDW